MKKAFINRLRSLAVVLVAAGTLGATVPVHADDFDDDDLYYSPAKAEKEKKAKEAARREASLKAQADYEARIARYDSLTAVYDASHPVKALDMNVDTYNRNGSFLVDGTRHNASDTASTTSARSSDSFAYTRRIERFHNDSIVSRSTDEELQDYYYASATSDPTVVNVYLNPPYAYSYGYYNPWYYNPWSWRYNWSFGWGGWYDPWYDFGWGPTWGWSWGWGPGWAPGPWIPGPGYPTWGGRPWHPTGIPGASRPHRPTYAGGSGHGSNNRYGQAVSPSGTVRPGNMGRGRYGSSTGSYSRPTTAPTNNRTARPGNSGQGRNNYNNGNNSSPSNRNSYSPSRPSSSGRQSSGSYSSPSRGSHGGGHTGGGVSRGRGRR